MPVIKSAIKKNRQDKVRKKENDLFRQKLESALRNAKKLKTKKSVSAAFSLIDKAAKKHLVHKNKAARLKSSLSKGGTTKQKPAITTAIKKPAAKATVKTKKKIKK